MMKINEKSMTFQHIVAYLLLFAGVGLLYWGFYVDPTGQIDYSVLTAFGEISVFVGALLGIDYKYKKYVHDSMIKSNKDE